ncbi:hypothetical protein KEM48_005408 [Puccinia striiformis f. sp. tritici PST-130]|nr:hypothetical protein Pst134EB_028425 [Puccinia striiformis f. sp. tritici]KAI9616149.1 hypothetical protein KEM48_005408 [Puccinia striiformis f. sp. tritici PST-130]
MAPMNSNNRISHPMFVSGHFDIFQSVSLTHHTPAVATLTCSIAQIHKIVADGSTYGQFFYETSIAHLDNSTGQEASILIHAGGYGSATTVLRDDFVYSLDGRFIARTDLPDKPEPVVYFDSELTLNVGSSDKYTTGLANKVAVKGFGIVVDCKTVDVDGPGSTRQTDLHVLLRHTDYDNVNKDRAVFEALYIIPGNGLQRKTQGLYQLGREVLISGHMKGYNVERKVWQVQCLHLAVPSGNQTSVSATPQAGTAGSSSRRRGLVNISSLQSPSPAQGANAGAPMLVQDLSPTASSSRPRGVPHMVPPPGPNSAPSSKLAEPEEGEVSDAANADNDNHFVNTFSKKRTAPEMIADACRHMKSCR